ncbi:hypothetical protein ACVRXS_11840 [Streptococcus orisratti]|uniref:hypothetical protein n=1 Tax=Streptococcus orisratti TaxID=114652 RepID=UPI0003601F28|nr:hypothetical protein [Streptococcus orisratti]
MDNKSYDELLYEEKKYQQKLEELASQRKKDLLFEEEVMENARISQSCLTDLTYSTLSSDDYAKLMENIDLVSQLMKQLDGHFQEKAETYRKARAALEDRIEDLAVSKSRLLAETDKTVKGGIDGKS